MARELHVSINLRLQTDHQNRPQNPMPRPDTNGPNITKADTSTMQKGFAGLADPDPGGAGA